MAFDFGSHFFFQNRVVSYQSPKESLVGLHGSPRGWLRVLALFTIVPLAGSGTIMGFNHTLADVPSQHRWKTWPFLPWRLKRFSLDICSCMCTSHFGGTFGYAAYFTMMVLLGRLAQSVGLSCSINPD